MTKARPQKLLPKGMTGGRTAIHKPRQRETLFHSAEEKQAEIDRLAMIDRELQRHEAKMQVQLTTLQRKREEVSCRIQELQNLDLFEEG